MIAVFILNILLAASAFAGVAPVIDLQTALREAETNSPSLRSARSLEDASVESVRGARAGYLPRVDFVVGGSEGSPGAPAILGVDSDYSTSQRSGIGTGLVLRQTLWDFGRTGGSVDAAKAGTLLATQEGNLSKADVDLRVLRTFLDCAAIQSEIRDARSTVEEANVIAAETDKYVRSGQRSVIERYLVDAQAKEAATSVAELTARVPLVLNRLAIEMGRNSALANLTCPVLEGREAEVARLQGGGRSPLIDVGKAQSEVARFRLDQVKAESMPVLAGFVAGGYFSNTAVAGLERWNYGAGVELSLPLYAGNRIDADVGRFRAEALAREADLDFARQHVDTVNAKYDEQIQAMKVRLDSLDEERKMNDEAFRLAQKRYFSLQGTMIDLREALRNLDKTRTSVDETLYAYLVAVGERALFNGARPEGVTAR